MRFLGAIFLVSSEAWRVLWAQLELLRPLCDPLAALRVLRMWGALEYLPHMLVSWLVVDEWRLLRNKCLRVFVCVRRPPPLLMRVLLIRGAGRRFPFLGVPAFFQVTQPVVSSKQQLQQQPAAVVAIGVRQLILAPGR